MIRKYMPIGLKSLIKSIELKCLNYLNRNMHKKQLIKTFKKDKLNVAFLIVNESIWKYEKLYFLLKNDPKYNPVVFVCPFLTYGEDLMKQEMNSIYLSFKNSNYNVIKTLNEDGTFIDVKKEFEPDLVFFCTPWAHSKKKYQIRNFRDVLTCYVHYGFNTVESHYFNMETVLSCWKVFVETEFHKKSAELKAFNKGSNFIVTGYTGIDSLIDKNYNIKQVWKPQEKNKKKVIWAPHHTISGAKNAINYSTFLVYADFMLYLTERFQDSIQFAFKPHPNLRGKLNSDAIWGKDKTDLYFNKWENLANTQLNEGEYIDLFLGSDAMLHDSSSFIIEYLYTRKPVLFLYDNTKDYLLNDLGVEALKNIEKAMLKEDILSFLNMLVDEGVDEYKDKRDLFVDNKLMPPNNTLASVNIYNYLSTKFN